MSQEAASTCPVCHYDYKVQRAALAAFLQREEGGLAITLALIILAIIASGLMLRGSFQYWPMANDLLALALGGVAPWRKCIPVVRSSLKSLLKFPPLTSTDGLKQWTLKAYTITMSPSFKAHLGCLVDELGLGYAMDVVVLGGSFIGGIGFGSWLLNEAAMGFREGRERVICI
jgi:hypothetical protein